MKKLTLLVLFFFSSLAFAQTQVVENFDEPTDSTYWQYVIAEHSNPDSAYTNLTFQTDQVIEGSAVKVDWMAQNTESWGGFVKFYHILPDSQVYDFSAYDSISFYYYVETPQSLPGRAHIRFELYDVSDVPDTTSNTDNMEFYYSFEYDILDDSIPGWHKYTLPLLSDPNFWNGEGFNRTGWAGIVGNDKLDKDKIKGFGIEFSISGGGERDASGGTIYFDQIELSGIAANPWLIFNGKTLDPALEQFTWGQSSLELVQGGGADPATNAILWTQGDEWGNGWSGAGWNVDPPHSLVFLWGLDSLKFALKAEEGTNSPIRMQFESPAGKRGYTFDITADGQWHDYALPLRDFVVEDDAADFDSTNITVFQMMGEGNATAGKKLWIDYLWTGSPEIDVVPPAPPTGVSVVAGSYQNLVTWIDVPNEDGALYNVFASLNPISDLSSPDVEVIAMGVESGTQLATHVLMAPLTDQDLTYYYAVVCVDAAGNESDPVMTDPITNTAKGVTTIYPEAPAGFAADGDLSEWSEIPSFRMYPSDGSGTIVNNTTIDGDADLSVDAYVAVDADYLYFAFNVEDDIVSSDTTMQSYLIDSPDLYLGLYDWHGASHTGLQSGDEPDYHFRFNSNAARIDNIGSVIVERPGADYYWQPKFPTGYVVEGRYSLDSLAAIRGDARFVPQVGMRIPIDFSINDADATGEREGILTYSINNQDQSWADVSRWTYTWIGNSMSGVEDGIDNVVAKYELSQNYPNPFNPATVINYSLQKTGMVSLSVYNVLGQKVATLVNKVESAGVHNVTFDASNLTSGVYIYRIQAGSFTQSKKMILLK
jgi:hypothetical protein